MPLVGLGLGSALSSAIGSTAEYAAIALLIAFPDPLDTYRRQHVVNSDPAAPASTTPALQITAVKEIPSTAAISSNCDLNWEVVFDTQQYPEGAREIVARASDEAGEHKRP